ncbi:hypothetical protein KY366_06305 [Candidatus Woesearchaeota archaeon]|nr:hypothetical protein [Candidatus Woesearchaeota archaeon]
MRKLDYSIDLEHFKEIKEDLVPVLFTPHQFDLISKRFSNRKMSASENNEFSRAISKKMKAINKILKKEEAFVYGEEHIKKDRLRQALRYLNQFSRKFRDKHVIITGSFLYSQNYNDIDIFVISRYEKEDYTLDKFHINYFTEDVYSSLFFRSIRKLCISNKEMLQYPFKEKVDIDTFISLYQELFNDLDKNFKGTGSTLREFLLQSSFISNNPIPHSLDLKNEVDAILKVKNPKEIVKNIFVNTVLMGIEKKKALNAMRGMLSSYKGLIKEYKQHQEYYLDIMDAFNRVISIES